MAVRERYKSRAVRDVRGGKGCHATLLYTIDGTNSEINARLQLKAEAPAEYDTLPLQDYATEQIGHGLWLGTVTYASREPREELVRLDVRVADREDRVGHGSTMAERRRRRTDPDCGRPVRRADESR